MKNLINYIEAFSDHVEFLSFYFLDFNPIKSGFLVIKFFLQKYKDFVNLYSDPKYPLLVVCF